MAVTVTFATVHFTLNIPSTINVVTEYGLECLVFTETTIIESFTFGTCAIGETVQGTLFSIKNVGNEETWVTWNTTDFPTGFSITLSQNSVEKTIPQNDFSTSVQPGAYWDPYSTNPCMFFTITNNAASPGTYDFTINFHAADTSEG